MTYETICFKAPHLNAGQNHSGRFYTSFQNVINFAYEYANQPSRTGIRFKLQLPKPFVSDSHLPAYYLKHIHL